MGLETKEKPRFLNIKDPRVWFLTDLEKSAIHEPPEPLFISKYDVVHCGTNATLH